MTTEKHFVEECVAAMNRYRVIHQAAPLSYNHGIEQVAKNWADHLAKTSTMAHNPKAIYQGKDMGENIASHWSTNKADIYTGAHAAGQWYNEIERYSFKTHEGPKTGHFTQVIWKGSKEVGVGRSQSKDGTWIAVANFLPPGNIIGTYPQNVLLPKDGKVPVIKDSGHQGTSQHSAHPNANNNDLCTSHVCQAGHKDVIVTTTTETIKGHDGSTTVKVTEKTETSGHMTKVKVTETITGSDGSKTTKTTETTKTLETSGTHR